MKFKKQKKITQKMRKKLRHNLENSTTLNNTSDSNHESNQEEVKEFGRGKRKKKVPQYLQNNYALLIYTGAVTGPDKDEWVEAINDEKKSLEKNQTWKLESVSNNKILTNKWVFKQKEDGRYRARLVVRGCQQKYVLNYDE
uniref:Retrovirus-related Pol polyprotein from transposon TNT 1-94 n=1 Tax=Lygus hesperus TaxID=30085 RepID=A0A0A9ZCT1_LYGHE